MIWRSFSLDGRWVTLDSDHGGQGRQIYLLDVSEIVSRNLSWNKPWRKFKCVDLKSL